MMNRPDPPPRSPPCVVIVCLSGGGTTLRVQAGCTSFPRVFRSSWMGGTPIRFSQCLRFPEGRRALATMYNKSSISEETYNLSSFRCDFLIFAMRRSERFWGLVDDLDVHGRPQINLADSYYLPSAVSPSEIKQVIGGLTPETML